MKKYFRPVSLLLYFLSVLVFFFIGISYAGYVEAGKNQGLAAAAIVIGYGFIGSVLGFISALISVYLLDAKRIKEISLILLIALATFLFFYSVNYFLHVKPNQQKEAVRNETQTSLPAIKNEVTEAIDLKPVSKPLKVNSFKTEFFGVFKPNFMKFETLYFYPDSNIRMGQNRVDSLVFSENEYGNLDFAHKPSFVTPLHNKLDYGVLYFEVKNVSDDWIELIVNSDSGKSLYVLINAGSLFPYSQFLLQMNSVEPKTNGKSRLLSKPDINSSPIDAKYSHLKPLRIEDNWMQVQLLDDSLQSVGYGWIQWRDGQKLLINYSLFS